MAENASSINISTLSEVTGINSNNLSDHHPDGGNTQTKMSDFFFHSIDDSGDLYLGDLWDTPPTNGESVYADEGEVDVYIGPYIDSSYGPNATLGGEVTDDQGKTVYGKNEYPSGYSKIIADDQNAYVAGWMLEEGNLINVTVSGGNNEGHQLESITANVIPSRVKDSVFMIRLRISLDRSVSGLDVSVEINDPGYNDDIPGLNKTNPINKSANVQVIRPPLDVTGYAVRNYDSDGNPTEAEADIQYTPSGGNPPYDITLERRETPTQFKNWSSWTSQGEIAGAVSEGNEKTYTDSNLSSDRYYEWRVVAEDESLITESIVVKDYPANPF